jgi:hypothetical protein
VISLHHQAQTDSGAHPSYLMGTGGSFSRINLPEREADSISSSAKAMNVWSYTASPPYIFIPWCLIKYRDNFTFVIL